jgi:hypothetical protein
MREPHFCAVIGCGHHAHGKTRAALRSMRRTSLLFIVPLCSVYPCLPHLPSGSAILFFSLSDRQYGIQAASMVCYTAGVILYTFSRNRGLQRYLFRCPFVRNRLPSLAFRHTYFLVALFVLQTEALQLRPHLSPFWLTASGGSRSMPPFVTALTVVSAVLCISEIITNRSLLDRAHKESEAD